MCRFFFPVLFVMLALLIVPANSRADEDCVEGKKYGDQGTCRLDSYCGHWDKHTGCAEVTCVAMYDGRGVNADGTCMLNAMNLNDEGDIESSKWVMDFKEGDSFSFDFSCQNKITVYGTVTFTNIRYRGGGCPDSLGLRAK